MTGFRLTAPESLWGDAQFDRGGRVRYTLRRWWTREPARWAAWLMLNPSHANATRLDLTTSRVTHFSRSWGYDGWIVVNLYPLVSSTPGPMWAWADWRGNGPDWHARDDLAHNLQVIEDVGRLASLRMVAFGAEPEKRSPHWVEACLEAFRQPAHIAPFADERLYCLGTTKDGQPIHPLARGKWRVPDDQQPIVWEAP